MTVVANIINLLFQALNILIIARIVFSFVRVSPYHPTWGPIMKFVYDVTEPIMAPVRRILPPMSGLDFSPMIVLLLAGVVRTVLLQLLFGL